ncbi:MAG: hypothetical protein IJT91_01615 [Clostridia bacterium]|nr:hypothetical protein [Clostridia bacterium]
MRINKTAKALIAGFLSALMLIAPTAAYADNSASAAEETEYAAYDGGIGTDYAWVTPITSDAADQVNAGGHIEIPYDLPEYERDPLETVSAEASQPFYYAIGEGVGTYAKDQGQWGTCWAFSATGAAEASILAQKRTFNKGTVATASNIDLSELHTAFFFYNTETDPLGNMQNDRTAIVGYTYLTGGGNNMLTSFALMAWKGMALESTCPYGSITGQYHPVSQDLCHREAAHCRNMYWVDMNDIPLIKEMIVKYGGVIVSYNHAYLAYSDYYASYYMNQQYYANGHSVYLVGWNDSFNSYSLGSPGRAGAWIVKNSWGRGWGMKDPGSQGMYWMSYYDVTLRQDPGIVVDFEDCDNYDNNYQYDGTSGINSLSIPANPDDPTKLGNQFVVKASDYERLDAVSAAFASCNVNYSVQVYKKNGSKMTTEPDDGIPMLKTPVTGKTNLTGYYTIPLNQELVFRKGEVYSIVISIWHDTGNAAVFVDMNDFDNSWVHFVNSVEYGQSWFAWGQNAGWAELSRYVFPLNTSYRNGYTLRIKGYTSNVAPVTYDLTGLTADGAGYARLAHPYSAVLTAETVLPESIDVFMSGVLLTEGTSYTYDRTTGEVVINNVNGPVDIAASAGLHEHIWNGGVITTAPTCGDPGVKTYTCSVCGETMEEAIPATGRHTWDSGVVTTEPTTDSTGVRTYTCTVCGAEKRENIPALPSIVTVSKTGSYDIKITGLKAANTYTVRYATGAYSSVGAVKNGVNAGFVQIRNAYEATVTLPTYGVHTVAVVSGSETLYFDQVNITAADIRDHLVASANELNLRVENLVGASYVKLYQGGTAVLTVAAKNFSTDGLKTWADMTVPGSGIYIVRIVYADGGLVEGTVELTAPEAVVTSKGRVFTISDFGGAGNVSFMRLAKGTYTSAGAIKSAGDLRTYGAKYFKADAAAFAALDAVNGETTVYTVQIGYASGYSQFITFDIAPTVPTVTAGGDYITLAGVDGIDWVRCAPGAHTSLYAIRRAVGSQIRYGADAVNGTVTFNGLYPRTYTLYYLYNGYDLSEGMITVTVK